MPHRVHQWSAEPWTTIQTVERKSISLEYRFMGLHPSFYQQKPTARMVTGAFGRSFTASRRKRDPWLFVLVPQPDSVFGPIPTEPESLISDIACFRRCLIAQAVGISKAAPDTGRLPPWRPLKHARLPYPDFPDPYIAWPPGAETADSLRD